MSRGGTLGVVALALALALSASASAATRYVEKTGSSDTGDCTNHASPCATIMYAVFQAANGDTIQIGKGNFIEEVNTDKALNFVGAGAGTVALPLAATRIIGPAGTSSAGHPAMSLPSGGTVRGLRVEGGPGSSSSVVPSGEAGGTGIVFPSDTSASATLRLEEAVVVGGDGGYGKEYRGTAGVGLRMSSGPGPVALSATNTEFAGGKGFGFGDGIWVDGPAASAEITSSRIPNEDAEAFGDGLVVFEGAKVSLQSTEVSTGKLGATVYDGSLSIDHSRITAEGTALYVSGSYEESPEAKVVDSLVVGRKAEALNVSSAEQASAAVDQR
jgi:hypothetical protein